MVLDLMDNLSTDVASDKRVKKQGAFRFDTGPSLLLFPETYQKTFRYLGEEMEDHVQVPLI
jgi:phytoene dehydrogenase-like protein